MDFIALDKAATQEHHTMNSFHSHSHYEIYLLTEGERTVFFYNTLYTVYGIKLHLPCPSLITCLQFHHLKKFIL